jgi:predicted N-acyltransferase
LIVRGREAQWRPAKLQAAPLKEASDWVEQYRQNWEESFDKLDAYLKTIQIKTRKRMKRSRIT